MPVGRRLSRTFAAGRTEGVRRAGVGTAFASRHESAAHSVAHLQNHNSSQALCVGLAQQRMASSVETMIQWLASGAPKDAKLELTAAGQVK